MQKILSQLKNYFQINTVSNNIDLKQEYLSIIIEAAKKVSAINRIKIFGSRAKGTARETSDIDIALYFEKEKTTSDLAKFYGILDDSDIPYLFDCVTVDEFLDEKMRENIERDGILIYKK